MVKSGDAQAVAIYEEYNGSVMTSFPQLSNEDIDNIIVYTDYTPPAPVAVSCTVPGCSCWSVWSSGLSNNIILCTCHWYFCHSCCNAVFGSKNLIAHCIS